MAGLPASNIVRSAAMSAREYELVRSDKGYGFTISGECPPVVTSILPSSSAEEKGLLPGMLVLEVDGIDVSRARHEDVVGLVANSRGTVRLLCSLSDVELDDILSNQRTASARLMNEQATLARKMSLPSSEESMPVNQALNEPFIPAERTESTDSCRLNTQRKSLMLALAAGRDTKTRETPNNVGQWESTEEWENSAVQETSVKLGYSVFRFPVAYFGSVQVASSKVTQQGRVDTIRRCVARVQAEGRCAPVTLEATSTSIALINPHGRILIEIPAHQLAYSCICIDDTRFFAIVTRRLKRHEKLLSGHRHPLCHVFMVNGPRKYASQDSLNQSAQETSHILKSIADILKTSKRQKGVQQSQPGEQIASDHLKSGSSDRHERGLYMIGRTVSVDNIIGQQSPNDWKGMSDPDLNMDIRRRSFHPAISPSLPTVLGSYSHQVSYRGNTTENDLPPDDYPEVWDVSDQDSVFDLPPPPPPLPQEPHESPQRDDADDLQSSPYHSGLPRQSVLQEKSVEMSSQLDSNIDQVAVNEHGLNEKLEQRAVEVSKSSNPLNVPDWYMEGYIPRLQSLEGRRGRASVREKSSFDAVRPHSRMPRVAAIERDVPQRYQGVELGTSNDPEAKTPVSPGAQSHNYRLNDGKQGGIILSTSMDSLALMSTVGSEYSVCSDVKRIASWALSLTRLLKDQEGVACLKEFMRSEHSDENLLFWIQCQEFAESRDLVTQAAAQAIYDEFLAENAPTPVNVDFHTIHQVAESLNSPHKDMFAKAQREVFRLMKMDCHPRFIRSTLYQQCVVAEMENLPLPIDPPSPKANGTGKVKLRSSSFQATSSSQESGTDAFASTKSSLSISSGYGSPCEERKKKEKEKRRRGILWGIRKRIKSQSSEELNGVRYSTAAGVSEEGRLDEFKQLADAHGTSNEQMFRAIMPDSSSTIVMAKHGSTVKEALQGLFERRKLDFELLDVVIQSNGEVVPYEAPVSCLHYKEIRLQRTGLTFKALFPDDVQVTVKVNKKKTIRDVLSGVMAQRGLDIDCYVVHLENCPVPLQLDISSSLLVNQSILIKPTAQITRELYENESSASPDRGYQSERPSSSLSAQSEQSNVFKVKTCSTDERRSTDMEPEKTKQKKTKQDEKTAASDDVVPSGELTTCLQSSPRGNRSKRDSGREEETKKSEKNRKSSKRKGKEDKRSSTEMQSRGLMPAPSTDDLIMLLNRMQCDRLDDQRTGLPSPDPLPDLLIQRRHSQPDFPDRDSDQPALSPRSDSSGSRQSLTLPYTTKEIRQQSPLADGRSSSVAPRQRSLDIPADDKWAAERANEQSLSVPDLCPVDDPTFARPPDITDVDTGNAASVTRRVGQTRSRRKDRQPIASTPALDTSSRSYRYGDDSPIGTRQDRRRVEKSLKTTQHPLSRYQLPHDGWRQSKRRDRLVGQNSLDATGMSETSVTFV